MIENLVVAGMFAVGITVITRRKNALTWPAVLLADGMLIYISMMSRYIEAIFLIGMYAVVFLTDIIFGKKIESATKEIHEKGGTRGVKQILANGSAACVCILCYRIFNNPAFLIAYYASVFEVMADSVASDVGVLSKRPPRDICTWKTVPRGISGGVSVLGLCASGTACLVMGLAAGIVLRCNGVQILNLILAPYLGMLADSVIGSLVQVKYQCPVCKIRTEKEKHCGTNTVVCGGIGRVSNSIVNFVCTVFAAVIGYFVCTVV